MSGKIAALVFAVFALAGSYVLHYYLPRTATVTVTGLDAKRAEGIPARSDTVAVQPLDVYFLYVNNADGKPQIYRNANTAWGWPPYFKFGAADLQAKAQSLTGQPAVIRYYGWRIKLLNMFPNITSMEAYSADISLTPWARYVGFGIWGFLLILVFPHYLGIFMRGKDE